MTEHKGLNLCDICEKNYGDRIEFWEVDLDAACGR